MDEVFRPSTLDRPAAGTHIQLDPVTAALLRDLARAERRNMTAVVCHALKQYAALRAAS